MNLMTIIERQFRRPSGLLGRLVGLFMSRSNKQIVESALQLLKLQPSDQVLEVGFGPGHGIRRASKTAAFVAGVDFSETMLAVASRRNRSAIRDGRVELRKADAAKLPYDSNSFDKLFSVNTVYFFSDPSVPVREMCRVLKPGGILVFSFYSETELGQRGVASSGPVFHVYPTDLIVSLVAGSGCANVAARTDEQTGFVHVLACKSAAS
ncbi:MAG: class I SAM-dependent methyltransferase [Actinobacteria bacterium]|nr:MAG: class I SAM-dependent methyltransferase [Actinomycetota bacterium]